MSASVQAVCPGCRTVLRIPVEWADRQMKCKKCGTLIVGKKKTKEPGSGVSPSATTDTAPSAPVPAPSSTPFPKSSAASTRGAPSIPVSPAPTAYPYPEPPGGLPHQPVIGQPVVVQPVVAQPVVTQPVIAQPVIAQPVIAQPVIAQPDFVLPESPFAPDPDLPLRRTQYRRSGGSTWVAALIILIICGGIAGGGWYAWKEMEKQEQIQKERQARLNQDLDPKSAANSALPTLETAAGIEAFPRRMLFIHISKYIYFNNLTPGTTLRGQDIPAVTARKIAFDWRIPTDPQRQQLFVLSDSQDNQANSTFVPPIKPVLVKAIRDFCQTSRQQDRLVLYFGGHATTIEDEAYLVPVEGEPDNPETLIPISEVYKLLADSPAQQKALILDVCRFNPVYGAAKPGSEPMSPKLAELLSNVPSGVQLVVTCSANENAYENQDNGSEFLTAWRIVADQNRVQGLKSPPTPESPIPINQWMTQAKAALTVRRESTPPQTLQILGQEPSSSLYNPEEPLPAKLTWYEPPRGATQDLVERLFMAGQLPGLRKDLELPPGIATVYPFKADLVRAYVDDDKDSKRTKLRDAVRKAMQTIRDQWKFGEEGLRDTLMGDVDDNAKRNALAEQTTPALVELELRTHLDELENLASELEQESSKHWQAMYKYALAQLKLRWAFNEEYRLALGRIRTDNLPKPSGSTKIAGWRLAATEKMMSKKDVQEKVDEARELFEQISADHRGTPWEVLAKMHKNLAVGLKWEVIPETPKEKDSP